MCYSAMRDVSQKANGSLPVTNHFRVQGYTNNALNQIGDIQIDSQGSPAGWVVDEITFWSDGKVTVKRDNGITMLRAQILLQQYRWPYGLQPAGGRLFTNLYASIPRSSQSAPGANGTGYLSPGIEIPPAVPHQMRPTTGLCLTVSGMETSVVIEESSDLIHWTPVVSVETYYLSDYSFYPTNRLNMSSSYYRTRSRD